MKKSSSPQVIQMNHMGSPPIYSGAQDDAYEISQPPPPPSLLPRNSLIDVPNISDAKKSTILHNGVDHHLIPVEIEKDAELGLVIGKVEGDPWIFIDEILPNGMIDMHGVLKEGDYLIQAGVYSLIGVDIPTALLLIEQAYEDGRKTVSFTAARFEVKKSSNDTKGAHLLQTKQPPGYIQTQTPVPQPMPTIEIPEKQSIASNRRQSEQKISSKETRLNSHRTASSKENQEDTVTQF